jgi:hypothetical protein
VRRYPGGVNKHFRMSISSHTGYLLKKLSIIDKVHSLCELL